MTDRAMSLQSAKNKVKKFYGLFQWAKEKGLPIVDRTGSIYYECLSRLSYCDGEKFTAWYDAGKYKL